MGSGRTKFGDIHTPGIPKIQSEGNSAAILTFEKEVSQKSVLDNSSSRSSLLQNLLHLWNSCLAKTAKGDTVVYVTQFYKHFHINVLSGSVEPWSCWSLIFLCLVSSVFGGWSIRLCNDLLSDGTRALNFLSQTRVKFLRLCVDFTVLPITCGWCLGLDKQNLKIKGDICLSAEAAGAIRSTFVNRNIQKFDRVLSLIEQCQDIVEFLCRRRWFQLRVAWKQSTPLWNKSTLINQTRYRLLQ